jgi:BMFP domain-containing protein YqiC
MESLQRETDELLGGPPTRSKTRRLARLRRSGELADAHRPPARPPLSAIAESMLTGFEQELTKRLRVLLQRIDIPSREELARLDQRVSALETRTSDVQGRGRRGTRSEPRSGRRMAK